ncbi:type II toxin-antitoxin system RelE/ParE family toxin [Adlercreutzia sp. ZJ473]|uniref:type II toxin-antitoxin system RelE/ParE family toxin n=1 Tax=Adlercreutzia sp. ZJ473 TaxID=2722822 RepID=UPI001552CE1E|nr:type II toxin-antitoxin system RelE/ParE family toxin [Adlercreutzia sp. ZJ473]
MTSRVDGEHAQDDALGRGYEVVLSSNALFVYLSISSSTELHAVDKTLELLGAFPHLGRLYDPLYEAARLPFDVYVTYVGRYGIYYEISDATRTVSIDFIEDQRRDPSHRFGDVEGFYG